METTILLCHLNFMHLCHEYGPPAQLCQIYQRKNQLVQEVRSIAIQLHEEGKERFGYKVSRRLNKPLTIIQDVALEALQEIRKELGYEQ